MVAQVLIMLNNFLNKAWLLGQQQVFKTQSLSGIFVRRLAVLFRGPGSWWAWQGGRCRGFQTLWPCEIQWTGTVVLGRDGTAMIHTSTSIGRAWTSFADGLWGATHDFSFRFVVHGGFKAVMRGRKRWWCRRCCVGRRLGRLPPAILHSAMKSKRHLYLDSHS